VPEFLTIENVLVSSGMSNCYNATQTITVAGGGTWFTVQSGGEANLIAGTSIVFMPGTTVLSGGKMHAWISTTYCPTPPAPGVKVAEGGLPGEAVAGGFRVYPNPTQGTFTLEMTGKATASAVAAELFRMQGDRLVKAEFQGDQSCRFDLNGQPSGVYILRILFDGKGETVKIIKN
jgi:hypothetical protein